MKIRVLESSEELGKEAAILAAEILNNSIAKNGSARLILSTGASQFDTLKALVNIDMEWNKVEMFHLDEYVNLPETHPASFRKYLKERFLNRVNLKAVHFVNGEGEVEKNIRELSMEIRKEPIDLGLIGIGENAHIAFNDPPANFDTREAYRIVSLDEDCKKQQVREGWFPSVDDVPKQAISMSVFQIMQCKAIISCIPFKVKANAIKLTLENELTNQIPSTMLKMHENVTLFIDKDSASTIDQNILKQYLKNQ